MAWEKAVVEARHWAEGSAVGFTVIAADVESKRIAFRAPCGSFYVTVPEKSSGEEWVRLLYGAHPWSSRRCARASLAQAVWSEEERCVQLLSDSIEYMSQPKRTLVEVGLVQSSNIYG